MFLTGPAWQPSTYSWDEKQNKNPKASLKIAFSPSSTPWQLAMGNMIFNKRLEDDVTHGGKGEDVANAQKVEHRIFPEHMYKVGQIEIIYDRFIIDSWFHS